MTSLFVKVSYCTSSCQVAWVYVIHKCFCQITNQMVTACKRYITDNGFCRVWDVQHHSLVKRMQASLKLYHDYQFHYQRTKRMMQMSASGHDFDFSEMYIFGKFEAFCKRLKKVQYSSETIVLCMYCTSRIFHTFILHTCMFEFHKFWYQQNFRTAPYGSRRDGSWGNVAVLFVWFSGLSVSP